MYQLATHLLLHESDKLIGRTQLDCHYLGLHHIDLADFGQSRARMFFAERPIVVADNYRVVPSGFHPHKSDIILDVIAGTLINHSTTVIEEITASNITDSLLAYEYEFYGYIGDKDNFKRIRKVRLSKPITRSIEKGNHLFMATDELHLVSCAADTIWIVWEGKQNPNFQSVTYSTQDLLPRMSRDMYRRPNAEQFEMLRKKLMDILFY